MSSEIAVLKRYLESKYLHVCDYWLECYLEWFKTQYSHYTQNSVCEKAYEQWLLLDLRDTKVRSLPPDLAKEKKYTLTGNYVVQVMYVKDISKSSLSQLRKIRNMYKLTGTSSTDTENEPQGKRMLSLYMTDGVEFIYGFEYHPIQSLKLGMTPGVKLHLTGPLSIRNGEILLKEKSVRVLGGEVEDLLVCNAAENVLARELNLPENPNPNTVSLEQVDTPERASNQTTIDTICANQNKINSDQNENRRTDTYTNKQNVRQQNDIPVYNQNASSSNFQRSIINRTPVLDMNIDDDDMMLAQISLIEEQTRHETRNSREVDFEVDFTNIELDIDMIEDEIREIEEIQACNEVILQQNKLPINVPAEPHIYIKQILDKRHKIKNGTYRVKAQFDHVIERLAVRSSKGWTMIFQITDGTGILTVNFSSEILSDLVGLSVEEALYLKQKIKNKHSESTELMKEALNGCKQKLTQLSCFMDLQFKEGIEMPTVVLLKPVDNGDLSQLRSRINNIKK